VGVREAKKRKKERVREQGIGKWDPTKFGEKIDAPGWKGK